MSSSLMTFASPLEAEDRDRMLEEPGWAPSYAVEVLHLDGSFVPLDALDSLMQETGDRIEAGHWSDDRTEVDRWLAPRMHWALRLTRAQAGDNGMWIWLNLRYVDFLAWRWGTGDVSSVAKDRWTGAVNKQAFARLWWGGELLRDGSDYRPVVRGFVRQDFTNSYLHRPVVRCRSLAQALLDVAAPAGRETSVSSDQVNDLARVVNLATAGAPPEAEIDHVGDDLDSYFKWVVQAAEPPFDWRLLPVGPPCRDTTEQSLERASAIAARCAGYAGLTAEEIEPARRGDEWAHAHNG